MMVELIDYRIETNDDFNRALQEIKEKMHLSSRVRDELLWAINQERDYSVVVKQKGLSHGLSLVKNNQKEFILTYYQFEK